MSFSFRKLLLFAFVIFPILFSCKNEVVAPADSFLSVNGSSSLSDNINSIAGIDGLNLEDYEVKSAIGPISTTECALDASNFLSEPEKFITGFDTTSGATPYKQVASGESIKISNPAKSDIWYIFTNTSGKDIKTPKFSVPGAAVPTDGGEDEEAIAILLPYIPKIGYTRGPGNVNVDKSIFPKGFNSGSAKLYTYCYYPESKSISGKTLRLKSREASKIEKMYEGLAYSLVSRKSVSSANLAVWILAVPLGGVPVIAGAISDDLVPSRILDFKFTYKQYIDLLFKKVRSKHEKYKDEEITVPDLYKMSSDDDDDSDNQSLKIENDGEGDGVDDIYYYPVELRPYRYLKDYFSYLFNNGLSTSFKKYRLWIPEGDSDKPTNIYNYINANYYNYYNPDDKLAFYITEGELGFGVYIPYLKWFYPIEARNGTQGYGYYVGNRLFKTSDISFNIPTDTGIATSNNRVINFYNSNFSSSSLNSDLIKKATKDRIDNKELGTPLRLIPKTQSSLDTKGVGDNSTSNLGDSVGSKQVFVELLTSSGNNYYRNATCRLVRTVDTAFGKRTLVIYEDDNLSNKLSDEEYQKIADAFLVAGSNNDIYDKVTNVFGSEWGYYNSTFFKSLDPDVKTPLIPKTNTLTLFYTDLGNVGNSSEYLSAAYIPDDLYLASKSQLSNERLMIHVHAPKASEQYLGESLIGIAREFEHLIHDQYFSQDISNYCYEEFLKKFGADRPNDESGFSDYFFSFLAKVISANTLRDKNYPVPASYNLSPANEYTDLFGLDKYYLYGMDKFDLLNLTLHAPEGVDYQSIAKAVISSFAYYLYTNFGSGFIQEYILGNTAGLEGIVKAINKIYGTTFTLSELLASWASATIRSSISSLNRPHTFNYLNRFKVQGVDYPNINFAKTTPYMSEKQGVPTSISEIVVNNSSACYKVAEDFVGDYSAVMPELPNGLELRLVLLTSTDLEGVPDANVPQF